MENQKNDNLIPISIVIAGFLIAGGIYLSGRGTSTREVAEEQLPKKTVIDKAVAQIREGDHVLGNPSAPVKIIEYSDLECPFCKTFHQTMRRIMDEYEESGKVAWVFRHFPLAQLHSKAFAEAEATECAGELGGNDAFWKYTDKIFEITPSNNGLAPDKLPEIAAGIGLNKDKFIQCLENGKFKDKINEEINEAENSGAQGTPFSILVASKGELIPINGAYPYEEMKRLIDEALK